MEPESPDNEAPMVVASGAEDGQQPELVAADEFARVQKRLVRITLGVFGSLFAIGIAAGFLFKVGYVAFVPGSARETESLVTVEGLEEFPSEGELYFTTVRVRSGLSLWSYLWHQMGDDNELVREEQVFGDRTVEENREINLERMASSKDLAVSVALEELGYDAISSDGVWILEVTEDSAAAAAGLAAGEVIVAVNDVPVLTTGQLVNAIAQNDPGAVATVTIEDRSGASSVVPVTLGARPDDEAVAFLGVATQERVDLKKDQLGIKVDIASGNVGGPSAGLAFTLAILDQLTEGELTGGQRVAVTGTIEIDGSVGPVGGVPQKTAAVRDLGIKTFIVPAALGEEEIEFLRERAGSDLDIVPVATLDEALEVLGTLGGEVQAVEEFAAANPAVTP